MSKITWSDLNSNNNILRLHEYCLNPKCKCQKQITFTPKHFQMEGVGFENTIKIYSKDLKKLGTNL